MRLEGAVSKRIGSKGQDLISRCRGCQVLLRSNAHMGSKGVTPVQHTLTQRTLLSKVYVLR